MTINLSVTEKNDEQHYIEYINYNQQNDDYSDSDSSNSIEYYEGTQYNGFV